MQAAPDRQDAWLKVTGKATYAAEHQLDNLAYAVVVQSTVGKGQVLRIDTRAALQNPQVLLVLTPETMPKLTPPDGEKPGGVGEGRLPLQDRKVHHDGQHLAVVVAGTLEAAQHAASLVNVEYAAEPPVVEIEGASDTFKSFSRSTISNIGAAMQLRVWRALPRKSRLSTRPRLSITTRLSPTLPSRRGRKAISLSTTLRRAWLGRAG